MDLFCFITKLNRKLENKSIHMSKEDIKKLYQADLEYCLANDKDLIYVIPIEEMAELTQHLSKIVRGIESTNDLGFLEELVDVQICIDKLRMFCNIDDEVFEYAKDIKLERIKRRIEDKNNVKD